MQIEFKVTISPEENKDLTPYTNAIERDLFLFTLFNNFFSKYDSEEAEKIKEDLFELKFDYGVITN
jgi:hypothetical protein